METFRLLMESAWVTAFSLIVTLVSIALAVTFYAKGKVVRRLSYAISNSSVIRHDQQKYPQLEIRYGGETVPEVTVTKVELANSGTETVRAEDISSHDPLRLSFPAGDRLLSWSVTDASRESCGAELIRPEADATVLLRFDFLDPGDGFTSEVIHTAGLSDKVQLTGTVKGIRDLDNAGWLIHLAGKGGLIAKLGAFQTFRALSLLLFYLYRRLVFPFVVAVTLITCIMAWIATAGHLGYPLPSRESISLLAGLALRFGLPLVILLSLTPLALAGLIAYAIWRRKPGPEDSSKANG
jgi:hypothetical protein